MGTYDVQQICTNGHQITDNYYRFPEFRRDFCNICGARTIHNCPFCNAEIKGHYHVDGVVALTGPSPVPSHCENCGVRFPWATIPAKIKRNIRISKITNWYMRLGMYKQIGLWGSIASIIGLVIAFQSQDVFSYNSTNQTISSGNQSPTIGMANGNVTINYNSTQDRDHKGYIMSSSSLVVSVPNLNAALDPSKHICTVESGTPIELTGKTAKMGTVDMWREIKILSGACSTKIGWVAIEKIQMK